jgi:prefoldin subunit 5
MSTYTITTNFSNKDTLPAGSTYRVIKGSEFGTEFSNIQVAINGNAQDISNIQSFTNAITATASELNVLDGATASTADLNKLAAITVTSTELNYLSGATSNLQNQINNISTTGLQTQIDTINDTLDSINTSITNLNSRVSFLEASIEFNNGGIQP